MQSFRIVKSDPVLASYIRNYWILSDDSVLPVSERTLPVGCLQLVFHKGKPLWLPTDSVLQPQAFICGQSVGFADVVSTGRIEMIVVVFQPYAARVFLDIPASMFFGKRVSIPDTGDKELAVLAERVMEASSHDDCIGWIEQFLIRRLSTFSGYHLARIAAVLQKIDLYPGIDISRLSDTACLSRKQFGRVFTEYVGTTPKEFIRIVRMQRALFALECDPTVSFAQLALMCGFFDQSHMIKEFRLFSGLTPAEYVSVCMPHSDYFSEP